MMSVVQERQIITPVNSTCINVAIKDLLVQVQTEEQGIYFFV